MTNPNLTSREIRDLCDKADEKDSSAYYLLTEDQSLSDDDFVEGLYKIIDS